MKIYNTDVINGLSKISDESIDVIIADPPYNIGKDFGNNETQLEIQEYSEWANEWIKESIRVLRPTGTFYIYGISENLAYLLPLIPIKKRWLVWHYTNKNSPTNPFWQRSHESIICAGKENQIFNKDDIREPYTEVFLKNAAGKKRKGTEGRFSKDGKTTIYNAHKNGALPRDVIKIPALAGGAGRVERFFYCKQCDDIYKLNKRPEHQDHDIVIHPTQKPSELSLKLLKAAKPKENCVAAVLFTGTGSELYAAQSLNMRCFGFEINEDYIKMANILLEKGYPQ